MHHGYIITSLANVTSVSVEKLWLRPSIESKKRSVRLCTLSLISTSSRSTMGRIVKLCGANWRKTKKLQTAVKNRTAYRQRISSRTSWCAYHKSSATYLVSNSPSTLVSTSISEALSCFRRATSLSANG